MENQSYISCCDGYIQGVWDVEQPARESLNKLVNLDAYRDGSPQDFQHLSNLRWVGPGQACAELDTETWKRKDNGLLSSVYTVHPTTLDGVAQMILPTLAQQHKDLPTMVPVHVSSVWIDSLNPTIRRGTLAVTASCTMRGFRGGSAELMASSPDSETPLIVLEGLDTTFISSEDTLASGDSLKRDICTRIVWKPDVDMMTWEQIRHHCTRGRPKPEAGTVEGRLTLLTTVMTFVQQAISFIDSHPSVNLEPQMESYVGWLRFQQDQLLNGKSQISAASVWNLQNDDKIRMSTIEQTAESGIEGRFLMRIGRSLVDILQGTCNPLQVMYEDGLVDLYYEKLLANDHHAFPTTAFVDLLCFKNPSMRILEVGAGTGAQTSQILKALSGGDGVRKWEHYDYTDISAGFFGDAQVKFKQHTDKMSFRVCDISDDPERQAFRSAWYDLVIASHVMHATNIMHESLSNIRKLLKPGGKWLLFETTKPEILDISFAFGLLKGGVEDWNLRLQQSGFTGVDMEVPGQEDVACRFSSIMISTATHEPIKSNSPPVILVVDAEVEAQSFIARTISDKLPRNFETCEICTISELAQREFSKSTLIVSLLEIDAIFLDEISEENFSSMQSVLSRSHDVLWVTKTPGDEVKPTAYMSVGLGRALMAEDSSLKFVSLSVDEVGQDLQAAAAFISSVAGQIPNQRIEDTETEFVVKNNILHVDRILKSAPMDLVVNNAKSKFRMEDRQLRGDVQLSLQVGSFTNQNMATWTESKASDSSSLQGDEILVEARAIGLTFGDYLVANMELDSSDFGSECAGVVKQAGRSAAFNVGDRVFLIGPSITHTELRVKCDSAFRIPNSLSYTQAASVPSSLWMAYHALVHVARLQRDETILVQKGASCISQMAIQIAKSLGAKVLTTASSSSKADFIHDQLGISRSAVLSENDVTSLSKVYEVTSGLGADILLVSCMEDSSLDLRQYLAEGGRFIDISINPSRMPQLWSKAPAANISQTSVNMRQFLKKIPSKSNQILQQAMRLFIDKNLSPPQPLYVFPVEEAAQAVKHFDDRDKIGKRVIDLDQESTIRASIATKPRCRFSADATYLIAGGLGGLGRRYAQWFADRGARNLILLSWSGASTPAAQKLLGELRSKGVSVAAPLCDISDAMVLKRELDRLAKRLPPIRGCVQATLALRDKPFTNLTYDDWVVSTNSKVKGSWNLHEALPENLDFFVLISSLNGIFGGRAQFNYTAGSVFKDGLAHYRTSRGLKAVSIDLGLVVSAGIVAEDERLLASVRRLGVLMEITDDEMMALMDYHCDADLPLLTGDDAQLLVGAETPAGILAKGIDLHHSIYRPLLRPLFQMTPENLRGGTGSRNGGRGGVDRHTALKLASSPEEAESLVATWFAGKLGQVLGLATEDVDLSRPVHTYGIDSLVSIDLRNWLSREIGADIEVFTILGNSTINELCAEASRTSKYREIPPLKND